MRFRVTQMAIVDQLYEEHLINFRENIFVLLMFHQICRKLPSLGRESVRAVSTEVGGIVREVSI